MRALLLLPILFSLNCFSYTILIDPGHGGDDLGAISGKVYEKNITLKISKLIYEELKKHHSVFMTRTLDRAVSLGSRAEIAEKVRADLFISVHVNSSTDKSSHGIETYYLDNHNDVAVKKVEKVENSMTSEEEMIVHQILTDLVVERTVTSSRRLSSMIHKEIGVEVVRAHGMVNRGVKPGLFYVLALSKRPGVLLEVGFMSNSKELSKILDKSFQKDYARAVVNGINRYLKSN